MLVTKNANNFTPHPNRRIQHGRDPKRLQVTMRQSARRRKGERVVRNDRTFGS